MRRKISCVILAAAMLAALAGCGGQTAQPEQTSAEFSINSNDHDFVSNWGYMAKSMGDYYFLTDTDAGGKIQSNGASLAEGEIRKLYVNNGTVYYLDRDGVNVLDQDGTRMLLEKDILNFAVVDGIIYYIDRDLENQLYCFDLENQTATLVWDSPVMLFRISSDYIVCWNPHDIYILNRDGYAQLHCIQSDNSFVGCCLDNDNIYYVEMEHTADQKYRIVQYDMKQDMGKVVLESEELISFLLAVDGKIVFLQAEGDRMGFRYIDAGDMEDHSLDVSEYSVYGGKEIIDIMFSGEQIVYLTNDQSIYTINISTGETREFEFNQ